MPQPDDRRLRALLAQFDVADVVPASALAFVAARAHLLRGWEIALARAVQRPPAPEIAEWLRSALKDLAQQEQAGDRAIDEALARTAEVEAALRLSWIGDVHRQAEGKRPTCDFKLGSANVEVYCPQKHQLERDVVRADLAAQASPSGGGLSVAIAISSPVTGSGRSLDADGKILRDPANNAIKYATNKVIDRVLSEKKREATQFVGGEPNILWLDLKHGLEQFAVDCIPLRSTLAKGMCFVGMTGVWHAFYGRTGDPLFADRAVLEYPVSSGQYPQRREGWFRETPLVSSVVLLVCDGVLWFDNPWAAQPLDRAQVRSVLSLSELRPELSWFDDSARTLEARVEAERSRISLLARLHIADK